MEDGFTNEDRKVLEDIAHSVEETNDKLKTIFSKLETGDWIYMLGIISVPIAILIGYLLS